MFAILKRNEEKKLNEMKIAAQERISKLRMYDIPESCIKHIIKRDIFYLKDHEQILLKLFERKESSSESRVSDAAIA